MDRHFLFGVPFTRGGCGRTFAVSIVPPRISFIVSSIFMMMMIIIIIIIILIIIIIIIKIINKCMGGMDTFEWNISRNADFCLPLLNCLKNTVLDFTCCKDVKLYIWVEWHKKCRLLFIPPDCLQKTVLYSTCCKEVKVWIWGRSDNNCRFSLYTLQLAWKHSFRFHMPLTRETIYLNQILEQMSIFSTTLKLPLKHSFKFHKL